MTKEVDLTYEAIKKALSEGRDLDGIADRELLERTLCKTPYMGPVTRKTRTGKRGPVPLGSQYSDALERRLASYHRIVKLPSIGREHGYLRNPAYMALVIEVLSDPNVKKRERRGRLSEKIVGARLPDVPEPRTLTRMLNAVEDHLKKLLGKPVP